MSSNLVVDSALWGIGKGTQVVDVKELVQERLNAENDDVIVDVKNLSDPAPGQRKTFAMEWHHKSSPEERHRVVVHERPTNEPSVRVELVD